MVQNSNRRTLDGSCVNIARLRTHNLFLRHDITAVAAFIDRDNISALIGDNGSGGEIGILSIDLDGNDYWVGKRLRRFGPGS